MKAGWACSQPGTGAYPAVTGPVRIPGPGGTFLSSPATGALLGWGGVPLVANFSCWCANGAGTFATPALGCAALACPFPQRCVDAWPGAPGNGTACAPGSQDIGCAMCSARYYRYKDDCLPCPNNARQLIAFLAILSCALPPAAPPRRTQGAAANDASRACSPTQLFC